MQSWTPLHSSLYCQRDVCVAGGGDDSQERRDDRDRLGGEHPVLGLGVERGRHQSGPRRPGLAAAARPRLPPPRIHVHHLLRLPALRELELRSAAAVAICI